ncbi:MAG: alpha/beta hydrolase [Gemmatimonadota bacterium]|nr:alpha/beta hydrolase [Gemmatimonadota bacterium]
MPSTVAATFHLDTIPVAGATKAPVLCLPGMFAGGWVFDGLLPLLAARGYPASAISFRGHPPLPPIASMGQQSLTDFAVDATAAARALDRPIVIGHSLGGLVALLMAEQNLIRAAVLVSPAPPRGISVLSPGILVRMASYLPAMLFSRAFLPTASHLNALVLNRVPDDERAAIRDRFVPDSGRAAREVTLGTYTVPPSAVRVPMLIVGAEHDRFIPVGVAHKMAKRYKAPFHLAAGHGHFLFAEPGWETQAAVVLDWIDALPQSIRDVPSEVGHK